MEEQTICEECEHEISRHGRHGCDVVIDYGRCGCQAWECVEVSEAEAKP